MTYKILSLDGGGFRGVISARILQEFEKKLGKPLYEYFDLVAGTSTGSLLAAGISLGKTADQLLELYQKNGGIIFPTETRAWRNISKLRIFFNCALYPHKGLEDVLQDQFGSTKISEISKDKPVLLIPAYSTRQRRTIWFCSNNPQSAPQWYDNIEIRKICVCFASAPTFFPPYNLEVPEPPLGKKLEKQPQPGEKYPFIDGGVAVNNPALIAIAHALLLPDHPSNNNKTNNERPLTLDKIAIVSIGTGNAKKEYSYDEVKSWGMLGWAMHLGDLFMPAPNKVNADVCWQIMRQANDENAKRVLRLDVEIGDNKKASELEPIDNPKLYGKFVEAPDKYLTNGKARVGKLESINPIKAIEEFIENNPIEKTQQSQTQQSQTQQSNGTSEALSLVG